MSGFPVYIELKVLVVYQEASSSLKYCKMGIVALRQHVQIITMSELSFDFDDLSAHFWPPDRVYVRPMSYEQKKRKKQN